MRRLQGSAGRIAVAYEEGALTSSSSEGLGCTVPVILGDAPKRLQCTAALTVV